MPQVTPRTAAESPTAFFKNKQAVQNGEAVKAAAFMYTGAITV